jgi:hypothetical protein
MWQDYVIFACMLAFSYALVPQVIQGFRQKKSFVNMQTSAITSAGMCVMTVTYLTMELFVSTIIGIVTASLWLALLFQGIRYGKK